MYFRRFIVICSIVLIAGFALYKFEEPSRTAKRRAQELLLSSDDGAVDRTITVWGDDWLGYLIFKSRAMQDSLRKKRIGIKYEQVFDFRERVKGLAEGKCDLIAITCDSYIANGKEFDYPGVILFLIDESYGGDAIIGGPGVANLDSLNSDKLNGAMVGNSPSEFLLKSSIAHFRLDRMAPRLKVFRRPSAENVYSEFKSGKADFAVLWEPFTSRALREIPGAKRLMDTTQSRSLVLDVTVASRSLMLRDPALADTVTRAYFVALHHYLNHPNELRALAQAYTGLQSADVDEMLRGVRFVSLDENRADWFGIASTGSGRINDSLQAIADILVRAGDFPNDPLNGNPYSLLNSRVLARMTDIPDLEPVNLAQSTTPFSAMNDREWDALPTTGTLLDEPINFAAGRADLDEDSQTLLREAARRLAYYPGQRVVVTAQVSPGNDATQDMELSQARSEAVRAFLLAAGADANRICARGKGSTGLPAQFPTETETAWKRRCRHARIYLVGSSIP